MPVDINHLLKIQQTMLRENQSAAPSTALAPPPVASPPADSKESRMLEYLAVVAKDAGKNVQAEVDRITSLPVEDVPSQEVVDIVSLYYCPDRSWILKPSQARALLQFHKYQGLFLPLKVGDGKTLISVLVASDGYSEFGMDKIILHCPVNLVRQLEHRELPKYRQHMSINVPFIYLSSMDQARRLRVARSGRKGVYVVPYSLLSSETGAQIVDAIQPKLIICDEVHKVASVKMTGRTRRFRETVEKYTPNIVALSGTITKKKLTEYYFVATHALKERSFLPGTLTQTEAWSKMIDSDAENLDAGTQGGGPIQPLIDWAQDLTGIPLPGNIVGFREAFRTRMETCPGVVSSDKDDLGVSLRIINRLTPKNVIEMTLGWKELTDFIKAVTEDWKTPDGDEIDYGIHLWKWRYELEGVGAYNSLFWPNIEVIQKKKHLKPTEAQHLLDDSQMCHEFGQEYHRALRGWLTYNARKGMDTPMLVGNNMLREGDKDVGSALYADWDRWREAKRDDLIERDSRFIRVCPFRIDECVKWAKEHHAKHPNEGAIIWYKHQGVGRWIHEALLAAGLPSIHCQAGRKYDDMFEDPDNRPHFAVSSISAHYQGHNCQHWGYEYFLQWPREAHIAEQAMGRIHRQGQERDECRIITNISSTFDQVLFSACLNDAAYIHQTTPTPQKLMYADYDNLPRIMPYAVLKEWGADPKKLNARMQQFLTETFVETEAVPA